MFRVRLSKESFTFSAAHFITYDGDVCEPLHGHNYRVTVEVAGPLDENQYVVDFVATRDAITKITAELDHRVLLATRHPRIAVRTEGDEVVATHGAKRWVFPLGDCVLLDVANTTAELLAHWIGERLAIALDTELGFRPTAIVVEVDECDGQVGVCRLSGS
ncbi:MAG: 6-pyruvoyl trahydropterin synthase family protein [Lacipirellulaceae bacterium]